MQGDPGPHFLIKDQFRILVAAVSQRRHKRIGCPHALGGWIVQLSHRPKINLHILARVAVNTHERFGLFGFQPMHKTSNGRIPTFISVVLLQPQPDGGHLHPRLHPFLDLLPVWLHCRCLLWCLHPRPQCLHQLTLARLCFCLFQITLVFRDPGILANRPTRNL